MDNCIKDKLLRVRVIVFNATFKNISVISWRSVFFVAETGVPGDNHRPVARHNVISGVHLLHRYAFHV
jgi:hypothetical protein